MRDITLNRRRQQPRTIHSVFLAERSRSAARDQRIINTAGLFTRDRCIVLFASPGASEHYHHLVPPSRLTQHLFLVEVHIGLGAEDRAEPCTKCLRRHIDFEHSAG